VLGTELRILQRILHTVGLSGRQWAICIVAALTIVVASEIQKLFARRQVEQAEQTAPA